MQFLLLNILAGLLSAFGMILFFAFTHRLLQNRLDVNRAMGTFVRPAWEKGLMPGIMIHLLFGVLWAFVYAFIFQFLPLSLGGNSTVVYVGLGFGLGFNHGMIAAMFFNTALALHPLEEAKENRLGLSMIFCGGHIIYGFLVGLFYGLFGLAS
jgi:hypothetical protein